MESKDRWDVIIVGGGLAGVATAIQLLRQSKRVLLIDRDLEARLGGMARDSFGGITMIDTPYQRRLGIRDDQELAAADWSRTAQFGPEDHWPRQWMNCYIERSIPDIYEWLRDQGVRFFPVVHWVERGWHEPANSVPRFHMVWGTGHGLIEALKSTLKSLSSQGRFALWTETKVHRLLMTGGRAVGVVCDRSRSGGGPADSVEAYGDAVVLAAGGICGDVQLVKKHWDARLGQVPKVLLNGAHRYADGTVHEAARAVGGRITHLEKQWNYAGGVSDPEGDTPLAGLSLVPPRSALWLDPSGKRIGPEPLIAGFDTRHLVATLCKNGWDHSWQILNYKIAAKELAISGSRHNPAIRDRKWLKFLWTILRGNGALVDQMLKSCEDFVAADGLSQLVQKMNALQGDHRVSLASVEEAVRSWDQMLSRGPTFLNDDQARRLLHLRQYRGDRVRTCRWQRILDPSAGPLIAIRERILTRKTLGGLQTDLQSRVLNDRGEVIPGLWAVGETAGFGGGGIHGTGALEGTFLGSCILTAQAAARSIAQ